MGKIVGETYVLSEETLLEQFDTYASSWESQVKGHDGKSGHMVGDEIEVGTLWEDKSQKDFKSYL